jgi:lipopolysaccharide transport system ATP-binding protein
MANPAISVQKVSKCYQVYESQGVRLKHALWPAHQRGVSQVWALKDISFEVSRGASMAIIGRNGSGKSTLLEIISQTLTPTTGEAKVFGRVAALLELGSGFKPEYTGRENVFLNGLLLGLTRNEIEQRYEDIISFADIGDVLDRPVKTYSSGMLVRLAFSVQVALKPDVLIVDEALSVGDYFFQQKCFGRLRRMREEGLTLLFVSHDMASVRDLCDEAVYLKGGCIQYSGDSKTAIQSYLNEGGFTQEINQHQNISSKIKLEILADNFELKKHRDGLEKFRSQALWKSSDPQKNIQAVRILGADGNVRNLVKIGDQLRIQVLFFSATNQQGHVGLALKNRFGNIVTNVGSYTLGLHEICASSNGYRIFEATVTMMLEAGNYSLRASFGSVLETNVGQPIDPGEWFGPLQIVWNYEVDRAPFLGMFGLPAAGKFLQIDEEPKIG